MNGRVFVEMSNGQTAAHPPLKAFGGTVSIVPSEDGSLRIELVSAASARGEMSVLIGIFNPGT